MDVTPLIARDRQVIQSYDLKNANAAFRISGKLYEGAVFVMPAQTQDWAVSVMGNDLTSTHFSPFLADLQKLDVLLLGTGATFHFPSASLQQELKTIGLKPDFMDTGAACRTYNVLMAEGRVIGALLLPFIKVSE